MTPMDAQERQELERYGSWERMTGGEWFLPSMSEAKEEHPVSYTHLTLPTNREV